MQGGHCFNTTVTTNGTTHTNFVIDGITSTAGLAVGMNVSDGAVNVAANTTIVSITSPTAIVVHPATIGSATVAITYTADTFRILLIGAAPATTFQNTQTNVGTPGTSASSTSNVGTDEVTGAGYTTGGFVLTNIGPSLPGSPAHVATISFSPNPSWTSASFSTSAAIIYNTSTRLGAAATPLSGRTIAVFDFGGTQTVAAGTLTLIMPTNNGASALIRIS